MKTHTVKSMIPWTCSKTLASEARPQKSNVNLSQLNPRKAMSTTKAKIGTILAIVVMRFMNAACLIPRARTAKMPQDRRETAMAEVQ